jgi:hypothetical protein
MKQPGLGESGFHREQQCCGPHPCLQFVRLPSPFFSHAPYRDLAGNFDCAIYCGVGIGSSHGTCGGFTGLLEQQLLAFSDRGCALPFAVACLLLFTRSQRENLQPMRCPCDAHVYGLHASRFAAQSFVEHKDRGAFFQRSSWVKIARTARAVCPPDTVSPCFLHTYDCRPM